MAATMLLFTTLCTLAAPATTTVSVSVAAPSPGPRQTWGPEDDWQRAPTPKPAAAPAPATPAAAPAPSSAPSNAASLAAQQAMRDDRRAGALGKSGVAILSLGAALGVGAALPLWLSYRAQLSDAESRQFTATRAIPAALAQQRLTEFRVVVGVSAGMAVAGTAMTIAGFSRRARLRRERAMRMTMAPVVGGGVYGATATVRF